MTRWLACCLLGASVASSTGPVPLSYEAIAQVCFVAAGAVSSEAPGVPWEALSEPVRNHWTSMVAAVQEGVPPGPPCMQTRLVQAVATVLLNEGVN